MTKTIMSLALLCIYAGAQPRTVVKIDGSKTPELITDARALRMLYRSDAAKASPARQIAFEKNLGLTSADLVAFKSEAQRWQDNLPKNHRDSADAISIIRLRSAMSQTGFAAITARLQREKGLISITRHSSPAKGGKLKAHCDEGGGDDGTGPCGNDSSQEVTIGEDAESDGSNFYGTSILDYDPGSCTEDGSDDCDVQEFAYNQAYVSTPDGNHNSCITDEEFDSSSSNSYSCTAEVAIDDPGTYNLTTLAQVTCLDGDIAEASPAGWSNLYYSGYGTTGWSPVLAINTGVLGWIYEFQGTFNPLGYNCPGHGSQTNVVFTEWEWGEIYPPNYTQCIDVYSSNSGWNYRVTCKQQASDAGLYCN